MDLTISQRSVFRANVTNVAFTFSSCERGGGSPEFPLGVTGGEDAVASIGSSTGLVVNAGFLSNMVLGAAPPVGFGIGNEDEDIKYRIMSPYTPLAKIELDHRVDTDKECKENISQYSRRSSCHG